MWLLQNLGGIAKAPNMVKLKFVKIVKLCDRLNFFPVIILDRYLNLYLCMQLRSGVTFSMKPNLIVPV